MAVYQLNSANFVDMYMKFYCFFLIKKQDDTVHQKSSINLILPFCFKDYIQSKCCSIPLLQDALIGIRLLHCFEMSRFTFHLNSNRKSLEEYSFSYQVSTHVPYLSKPTINLRDNLVQVVIFTVSLIELFENYTDRRTNVYSGRMTRLKYPACLLLNHLYESERSRAQDRALRYSCIDYTSFRFRTIGHDILFPVRQVTFKKTQ